RSLHAAVLPEEGRAIPRVRHRDAEVHVVGEERAAVHGVRSRDRPVVAAEARERVLAHEGTLGPWGLEPRGARGRTTEVHDRRGGHRRAGKPTGSEPRGPYGGRMEGEDDTGTGEG